MKSGRNLEALNEGRCGVGIARAKTTGNRERREEEREGKETVTLASCFLFTPFPLLFTRGLLKAAGRTTIVPSKSVTTLSLSLSLSLCLSVSLFATQSKGDLSSPCAAERPASRKRANRISG